MTPLNISLLSPMYRLFKNVCEKTKNIISVLVRRYGLNKELILLILIFYLVSSIAYFLYCLETIFIWKTQK